MTATTTAALGADGHIHGYGTKAYRSYVLSALMFIYILNFIDRGLLAVVGPVLLTAKAEQPRQTLWSADGDGILTATQTPVARGGLSASTQPTHTSWFTVDAWSDEVKPLRLGARAGHS